MFLNMTVIVFVCATLYKSVQNKFSRTRELVEKTTNQLLLVCLFSYQTSREAWFVNAHFPLCTLYLFTIAV